MAPDNADYAGAQMILFLICCGGVAAIWFAALIAQRTPTTRVPSWMTREHLDQLNTSRRHNRVD